MTNQQIFLSILGGGVGGAVVTVFAGYIKQRSERGFKLLNDRIRLLYGPLYYFLYQNKQLFEASSEVLRAGGKAYGGINGAMEIVDGVTKTINVAQAYSSQIRENNEKIMQLLEDNFSFASPKDYASLINFTKDIYRGKFERPKQDGGGAPLSVSISLPPILIFDTKFMELVEGTYLALQKQLEEYCDANPDLWWK